MPLCILWVVQKMRAENIREDANMHKVDLVPQPSDDVHNKVVPDGAHLLSLAKAC
jgi:hypothetical protein